MICRYFTKTKFRINRDSDLMYIDYYGYPYRDIKQFTKEFLSTYKVIYLDWFKNEDLNL